MDTTYITKTLTAFEDISGRIATKLSQTAFSYDKASIFIQKNAENDRRVSAKSLLGILSLGIRKGDKIDILISNDSGNGAEILAHLMTVVGGTL